MHHLHWVFVCQPYIICIIHWSGVSINSFVLLYLFSNTLFSLFLSVIFWVCYHGEKRWRPPTKLVHYFHLIACCHGDQLLDLYDYSNSFLMFDCFFFIHSCIWLMNQPILSPLYLFKSWTLWSSKFKKLYNMVED